MRMPPQTITTAALLMLFLTGTVTAQAETTLNIDNASRQYQFTIRLNGDCEPPDEGEFASCEGPATLAVTAKGKTAPLQEINLENVFISFAGSEKPLVNSARMYDYQGVINTGDFNFDGHEDFAIQNGNNGPYGGPSYTVFLYSPANGRFAESISFSSLTMETLGFFKVDPRKKQLETMAKSGCCYHEFVKYRVINNEPVAVFRRIEDATSLEDNTVHITEEQLTGSTWKKIKDKRIGKDKY